MHYAAWWPITEYLIPILDSAQTRSSDWLQTAELEDKQTFSGVVTVLLSPWLMAHNEGASPLFLSKKFPAPSLTTHSGDSSAHTWLMFQLRGRALRKETLIMDYNLGVVCSNNQQIWIFVDFINIPLPLPFPSPIPIYFCSGMLLLLVTMENISHLVPILHKMTDAVLMMIKIACLLSAPGHRSVDTAATNITILQINNDLVSLSSKLTDKWFLQR